MRRTLLIAAAVAGLTAGIVGLTGSTARALAATAGLREPPVAQAPQATPSGICPFADGTGAPSVEAMRAHMEATHGAGAWERMQGWMGGAGANGSSGMGGMMGPGARR